MYKKYLVISIFLIVSLFSVNFLVKAAGNNLAENLSGRILLQVEENGEAWYVNPESKERSFLGRPDDAFNIMRQAGIGITNDDLNKIPLALGETSGEDSDNDGLPDAVETAIGTNPNNNDSDGDGYNDYEELLNEYNPLGQGRMNVNADFSKKQSGKILLQVERNGEAWYVNPEDSRRYFMGRPGDAYNLMRRLGLGISNTDLEKINRNQNGNGEGQGSDNDIDDDTLTLTQAKELVEEFINNNLMSEGETATVNDISEEYGLYKLAIDIETDIMNSYMTKNGEYFFGSGFDLENMMVDRTFSNEELSEDELKEISKEFIDNELTMPDVYSTIIGIYKEDVALYKIEVDLGEDDITESYITKNGKLFLPHAFSIDDVIEDNIDLINNASEELLGDFEDELLACEPGAEGAYPLETEMNMFGAILVSKTENEVEVKGDVGNDKCQIIKKTKQSELKLKNFDEIFSEQMKDLEKQLVEESDKSEEYIANLFNTLIGDTSEEDRNIFINAGVNEDVFSPENETKTIRDTFYQITKTMMLDDFNEYQEIDAQETCEGEPENLLEYLTNSSIMASASCSMSSSLVVCEYSNGVVCEQVPEIVNEEN